MPMDLNRKMPPTGGVTIEPTCSANFLKAKAAQRADSFVGVTVLPPKVAIPTFYMFPCFIKGEEWAISSARTDDSPYSKSARLSKPLDVNTYYGGENNVVWVEGDEFDGRSHHACMALINHYHRGSFVNVDAGIVDDDVIGWGIKPTIVAGQVTCWLLRYASSRNLGRKFTPRAPMAQEQNESAMDFQARKDAREKREDRDLPKAWAEWVRSVLCNNLGVVHGWDERLPTGNKTSRTSTVV